MESQHHKCPDQTHKPTYPRLFLPADVPVSHLIEKEFKVKLPIGAGHGRNEEAAIQIHWVPDDQYLFIEAKYLHFYYRLRGMKWDVSGMETIQTEDRILHRLIMSAVYDDGKNIYEEATYMYFDITAFVDKADGISRSASQLLYFDYHGYLQEKGYEFLPFQSN